MTLDLFTSGSAVLSECGRYRYRLDRTVDPSKQGRVCWVMLNPSTADASVDDPTLRRCIGYTRAWHHAALVVVNLFAWRATDPSDLPADIGEAVGPLADEHIVAALRVSSLVVCGWGAIGRREHVLTRRRAVLDLIASCGHQPMALARTKCGNPRHPLYLRADARPTAWCEQRSR